MEQQKDPRKTTLAQCTEGMSDMYAHVLVGGMDHLHEL